MYKQAILSNPSLTSLTILVVDDSEISKLIVKKFLNESGFENVFFASNGIEAIKQLEELTPSIIVTDLYMPEMDGFELCKKIKAIKKFSNIPIIIQTSASDSSEISKAFDAGAGDVVIKPLQKDEFLNRLIIHLENGIFRKRIKEELEAAIELQTSIMPTSEDIKDISDKYSVDVAALFKPCSEVGGDFWGFKEATHSELSIYNVDLSGHGVASAMNSLRIHTLMQVNLGVLPTSDLFLRKLNKKVCEVMPVGQYATIYYGIINFEDNYIEWTNGAAPLPIILRANGSTEILEGTFLPVGVTKEITYNSQKTPFAKGDSLILFSDALIETSNENGEFLTQAKISKLLSKYNGKTSQNLLDFIVENFNSFIGKNIVNDDLTINIYKRV